MKKKELEKIAEYIGVYDCALICIALENYKPYDGVEKKTAEELYDMFYELKEELKSLKNE